MAPLAIGCSLMVMVYMGGHISGGHYNPAVSLAVLLRGKMPGKDFIPYVVAQVLGAIVAAYLSSVIFGRTIPIAPSANASAAAALLVDIFFTFALALVVLNVATHPDVKGNSFYGLAIGFTIVVAAFAGGGISGGAFDPAVGTGITLVHALLGGGSFAGLVALSGGTLRRWGSGGCGLQDSGRGRGLNWNTVSASGMLWLWKAA